MNLYLLSQDVNNKYDTYDLVVVAAESEEDAKTIHPSSWDDGEIVDGYFGSYNRNGIFEPADDRGTWVAKLSDIKVELIGKAVGGTVRGVILASFNAG